MNDERAKGDPQYASGKFAEVVYSMATSDGTLRQRVGSAVVSLIAVEDRDMPNEETLSLWRELGSARSIEPLEQLDDARIRKVAQLICDIDSALASVLSTRNLSTIVAAADDEAALIARAVDGIGKSIVGAIETTGSQVEAAVERILRAVEGMSPRPAPSKGPRRAKKKTR